MTPCRYFYVKNVVDPILAFLLLVPALPVMALLMLLVRLTSPGPGIYRQRRVGKRGRLFTMYKIRTMRCDAEAKSGPVWTTVKDPRMTRLGEFLRRFHLDELPQLFNVLRGHMYLIGPRPERPEFVRILTGEIPGYMDRLAVRPGVTGLAQMNLPPDSDLCSVCRKLTLDVHYIRNAGFFLDARALLATAAGLIGLGDKSLDPLGLRFTVRKPARPCRFSNGDGARPRPGTPADLVVTPKSDQLDRCVSARLTDAEGNGELKPQKEQVRVKETVCRCDDGDAQLVRVASDAQANVSAADGNGKHEPVPVEQGDEEATPDDLESIRRRKPR
jgi:lipopolysaccharide/colanic/teichoic acid biosynthesis glycosyltransferase